jgi:hypothetical protein
VTGQEARRDVQFWEAIIAADHAASVAHDFIWGRNDVTREQADGAIWAIHTALRPFIDFDGGDEAGYLEGREVDPDLAERLRNIDDAALRNYLANKAVSA